MASIELAAGLQAETGAPWPGVRYFTTWRGGGASATPFDSLNLGLHVSDTESAVLENRRRLRQCLPAEPLWLDQVHGTTVHDADRGVAQSGASARPALALPPCADAAVTVQPRHPLAILTADCLPVVLADLDAGVLGVAHAGWRGLLAGVLENLLREMRARQPQARRWRAWIGPGIGPDAFEVGPEVRARFLSLAAQDARHFVACTGTDRWLADLPGLARSRLRRAGVAGIEISAACTHGLPERFFSYRRQACTGRQATVAWLDP
ncbi:peptidoglycan editing factor PgeF [Castellaniella sp.]|uniref:peptidoglycan editing factor PgeF n=1 Tax=Castellaniella sp. TaxID=1955812 RepID=UPI00355EC004